MTTTPIARTRSSHTRLLFVCSKDELKKARIALSKELALSKKAHAETKRSLEELKQAVYDQGCQLATMQAEQAKKAAAPAAAAPAAPAPALTGKRGPPQLVSS